LSFSLRQKLTLLFVIPTVDGEICYGCVMAMVVVVVVVAVFAVKNGTIAISNRHPRYMLFHFFSSAPHVTNTLLLHSPGYKITPHLFYPVDLQQLHAYVHHNPPSPCKNVTLRQGCACARR
jgi:hypothetical protein